MHDLARSFGEVVLHKLQIQVCLPVLKLNKSIPLHKEKGKLIRIYAMGCCLLGNIPKRCETFTSRSVEVTTCLTAIERNYSAEFPYVQSIFLITPVCNIERFFNQNHKYLSKSNALWLLSLVFSL